MQQLTRPRVIYSPAEGPSWDILASGEHDSPGRHWTGCCWDSSRVRDGARLHVLFVVASLVQEATEDELVRARAPRGGVQQDMLRGRYGLLR
ncbi:hypothetical protein PF001_g23088 [Phytophthora fragariae]|uniref:Uncharacterized protein n=1 Tax=Phytophthora fragariae TaxID=53985 RepID=A0A6A4C119_9STRA|nr:hypothetical protein PF003_g25774 [Phytophthora fragariae]KAE9282913.1 hypothetical protein PF001_g23088 [Phytophthora fragariae]